MDGSAVADGGNGSLAAFKPEWQPFVRHDAYGEAGLAKQSLMAQLRLALLAVTLLPLRVAGALGCVITVFLICRAAPILFPPAYRNQIVAALVEFWCRVCLLCLGFVRVTWKTLPSPHVTEQHTSQPAAPAIVSNHVSWADILINMARYFPSFVARDGTQKIPFIGIVSQRMQCIYVERERSDKGSLKGVSTLVKERMLWKQEHPHDTTRPMLLFPEGTTSNGRYLLPFKTGAFLAGVPVQPVLLRYHQGRVSPAWETIEAPRHLFLMLCEPMHSITCVELPVYTPNEQERKDPVLYAQNVRQYMLSYAKDLSPSDSSLAEKRAYQDWLRAKHPSLKPLNKASKKQS